MSCVADNVLAELVDGTLAPDARDRVEQHLDDCIACSRVVTELAGLVAPPPPGPPGYRLLRALGDATWQAEAANGDATLAVTFGVRCDPALVGVDDPHVAKIHTTGEVDGKPFVVHAIVTRTERAWRELRPHTSDEILAVWRQALAGLAAIHRARATLALSPEHVFVEPDGRVLVAGFLPPPARASGYLAPERLRDGPPSARADQFSACVAIWEALAGRRPFEGATVGALAVSTATPPEPPEPRAPRYHALARGLSHDPARRWPDIAALLTALDRNPRTNRLVIAVLAIVVLGSAIALLAR